MSADYAEKEREFLACLEADTGRDLEAWMAAIETQGLTERNEIIDWLREQGFLFSKASWLERIHNNSGKPIYGVGAARARAVKRPRSKPGPSSSPANANPAPDAPARAEEPPRCAAEAGQARARRAPRHRKGLPPAGQLCAG